MPVISGGSSGGGSGTVTQVASADSSVSVANPTTTPTLQLATLDVIATNEKPIAAVAMNAQKITGLANGSAATDALAVGQVLAANVIPVGDIVAGTAGQVLGGTGPGYALPPGFEIGYDPITNVVNIVSTTEATGTTIITCGSHTFDGAAVMVEFFSPEIFTPSVSGQAVVVSLFEGGTQIGRLFQVNTSAAANHFVGQPGRLRFTPTAGAHTYTITAFANSTTGTPSVQAGAGGTGTLVPAFVRFTKV